MEGINGRLLKYGEELYKIKHKRKFVSLGSIEDMDKKECFDFSYEMAFGNGEHRNHRSGGNHKRKPGEIFINTYQGKMAEYAIYRYLEKNNINVSKPDLSVEGLGHWDSFDIEYQDLHIAVKSTKSYGNLLLLETKDWNKEGEYIPNNVDETDRTKKYDIFVLLRLDPDGESLMKVNNLLYKDQIDKMLLIEIIKKKQWNYDIAGYITNRDFMRLIEKEYILPQGAMLNGNSKMDAENYYVQSGNMRASNELIIRLLSYNKGIEQMF